jgi:aspartate kinase
MRNLATATALELRKGKQIAVVVSAMGKTTDMLIEHFLKACKSKDGTQELDDVLSMGERTSARLFAAALKAQRIDARYFDPLDSDWPIITDDTFGNAKPIIEECIKATKRAVLPMLEKGGVPVIPGFVGTTLMGKVTTLGRGGSDVTAFVLARAIKAEEVVMITDVDGIMTADPKIVSNPKRIGNIDATELVNLCDSGVKFIRRRALKYLDGSFEVRIIGNQKSELASEGTVVTGHLLENSDHLAYPSPVCVITIIGKGLTDEPEILLDILETTSDNRIPILARLIDTDTASICFPETRAKEVIETLHSTIIESKHKSAMALRKKLAFLRITNVESEDTSKILKQVIGSLEQKGINIFGVHTAASNILIFVDWTEKDAALLAVKEAYESLSQKP